MSEQTGSCFGPVIASEVATIERVAPPPSESSQRGNVPFGQTLPFAVKVHPLIALNAAPKPLTQASISTLFER